MNKTHREFFTVQAADCDPQGRLRLDALFVAMQEGGERHAIQLGVGYDAMKARGLFFVLTRIHVSTSRMPRLGETVVHTTWPGVSNRFFCPRYHVFTLEDGTPLCAAGALWAMLDTQTRTIVSPLKMDLGFPDTSDLPAPVSLPNRLPTLIPGGVQTVHIPSDNEFDVNGHINNTKYIAWLSDAVAHHDERLFIRELTAGYEKEIRSHSELTLGFSTADDSYSFVVSSADGEKHFVAGGTLSKEVSP